MTTFPAGRIIPAVTLALALLVASSCGSDETGSPATTAVASTSTPSSAAASTPATTTPATTTSAAAVAPTTTSAASSTSAQAAATTIAAAATTTAASLAPTTDVMKTPPIIADGTVEITVIVGTDSTPDRIEEIPLGSTDFEVESHEAETVLVVLRVS